MNKKGIIVDIFEDIKNGVLPNNNLLFELMENKITDKENESDIKNYINILNNSFENNLTITSEKILLNRVIFILEILIDNDDALKNFIYRALRLNIHEVTEEYLKFLDKFFLLIDEDILFNILNDRISDLIDLKNDELRSFFNWNLHKIWLINKFYASSRFMDFYDNLKKLIYDLRDSKRIDEMMYVEFFTYHIMGNNFQTSEEWKEFNKNVTKETIKVYETLIPQLSKPKKTQKEKKKIALIKDRIVDNSPYKMEYSLLKALLEYQDFKDKYQIIVYSFNQFEKSFDDENVIKEIENLGIEVKTPVSYFVEQGYYNNHLEKAKILRQTLIDDEIDIMIAGGVFPIFNFLYVTRTAPVQIYWSHGNLEFDIKGIDKKITATGGSMNDYIRLNIPRDLSKYNIKFEQILIDILKNRYPENALILGSIGRLVKLDNFEFWETIAKILKRNPNSVFLVCGNGDEEQIKSFIKTLDIEKHIHFEGMINTHIYSYLIDILFCPFPFGGGEVYAEYELKEHNGAVVYPDVINDIFFFDKSDEESLTFKHNQNPLYLEMVKTFYREFYRVDKIENFDKETLAMYRDKCLKEFFNIEVFYDERSFFGNSTEAYVNRAQLFIDNLEFRKYYGKYKREFRLRWDSIVKENFKNIVLGIFE